MTNRYSTLHLIEQLDLSHPVDDMHTETGHWAFTKAQAEMFIGCNLLLHRHQASPAHLGGRIVGFRREGIPGHPGEIVFKIRNDKTLEGITTSDDGWFHWWKAE
jgi:hypothetical protein